MEGGRVEEALSVSCWRDDGEVVHGARKMLTSYPPLFPAHHDHRPFGAPLQGRGRRGRGQEGGLCPQQVSGRRHGQEEKQGEWKG